MYHPIRQWRLSNQMAFCYMKQTTKSPWAGLMDNADIAAMLIVLQASMGL